MLKAIRWIQNYLLISLPFVIAVMVWSSLIHDKGRVDGPILLSGIWEVLSFNLMLWFLVLAGFLVVLAVVPRAREATLARLANLKERDEREEQITGRASRSAYLSTLSVLILLLFVSMLNVEWFRMPDARETDGKQDFISVGMGTDFLEKPSAASVVAGKEVVFSSQGLPLTKPAMVLVLMAWLLGSYNLRARRELAEE